MRPLWHDDQLHHHYRLVERTTKRVFEESIEIHTVELSKYNGTSDTVRGASDLNQWCYWIKNADQHTEEELRALLPGLAFLQATSELQEIYEITEEKEMYDSREKAILDYESSLIDARKEGHEEGREEGEAIGQAKGRIQLLQELLDGPSLTQQELNSMSLGELTTTMIELQTKLRQRKG